VKVLNDDPDEHVEHEEPDEQQERDEVEKAPFVVVSSRLQQTQTANARSGTMCNISNIILHYISCTPFVGFGSFV